MQHPLCEQPRAGWGRVRVEVPAASALALGVGVSIGIGATNVQCRSRTNRGMPCALVFDVLPIKFDVELDCGGWSGLGRPTNIL